MISETFSRKEDETRIQRPAKRQRQGPKGIRRKTLFKKRKGRSNLADNSTEAWQADGQWHDAAKGKGKKGKKGKGKGKYGKQEGKEGKGGSKDGAANLADSAQGSAAIAAATTFYTNHLDFNDFSFMATENHEAFITQPLTPTSMVLDLG